MKRRCSVLMGALLLYATMLQMHAATVTVTNTNDSGPGSLRQVLADANDGDTITFAVSGTITLTSGGLPITRNLTMSGPGADQLSIDGNQALLVLGIFPDKTAAISGLTIRNAEAGVWNQGTLAVSNCVLSGNSGGGIYNNQQSSLEIYGTILNAGASGENIVNNGGTVMTDGYNVSSDDGSGFLIGPGDQINTDPLLGPLEDNGGPTFTHLPLPGSPAIDAGNPSFTPPPLRDQRGVCFHRVFGRRIDVGSVEAQPEPRCPTPAPRPTPH